MQLMCQELMFLAYLRRLQVPSPPVKSKVLQVEGEVDSQPRTVQPFAVECTDVVDDGFLCCGVAHNVGAFEAFLTHA
jgi:hypothetical protein